MGRLDDKDDAGGMWRDGEGQGPRLGTGAKEKKVAVGGTHYAEIRYAVVVAASFVGAYYARGTASWETCNAMGEQHHQVRKQQRVQMDRVGKRP